VVGYAVMSASPERGPALVIGGRQFPLFRTTTMLGRRDRATGDAPDIDLVDVDVEQSVSRRHAELVCAPGAVVVRDLGSHNGTTRNGFAIAPAIPSNLRDGDVLRFGAVDARFELEATWPVGVQAEWTGATAGAPAARAEDWQDTVAVRRPPAAPSPATTDDVRPSVWRRLLGRARR